MIPDIINHDELFTLVQFISSKEGKPSVRNCILAWLGTKASEGVMDKLREKAMLRSEAAYLIEQFLESEGVKL